MESKIKLYGFGPNDRSSKIRWLAQELGLSVEEQPVQLGENRQFPYRDINPFAAIPVVQWGDKTLIESTAIMTYLAEQFPEASLIVQPDNPERFNYLKWMAISSDTLEAKVVEYNLAKIGIFPEAFAELNEKTLRFKLNVVSEQLPKQGYLVWNQFTLADINLAYSLKGALRCELVEASAVRDYLTLLSERPAAQRAGFFEVISELL